MDCTAISDITVHPFLTLHDAETSVLQKKYRLSLQTWPVIRFSKIYDRLSLTYESRMTIPSSTLNRIESRRFISEKISTFLDF